MTRIDIRDIGGRHCTFVEIKILSDQQEPVLYFGERPVEALEQDLLSLLKLVMSLIIIKS